MIKSFISNKLLINICLLKQWFVIMIVIQYSYVVFHVIIFWFKVDRCSLLCLTISKRVIRICKSEDRQRKQTNWTNKTIYKKNLKIEHATRTPLKPVGELGCSGTVSNSCSICGTRREYMMKSLKMAKE
jgi:hypothetical protein